MRRLAPAAGMGLHYRKNSGGHHGSFGETVMRTRAAVAVLMLVSAAGLSHGQNDKAKDKPKDALATAREEQDKKAAIAAYEAAVIGTDIFNKDRNYEGCFRLYQGALLGVLPAIDHHPALVASVRGKLDKAKSLPPGEGAGVLREALEQVQELGRVKKTLWERIGGEAGAKRLVADFVAAAIVDPKVNYNRGVKYPVHEKALEKLNGLLVEQLSFLTGGPGKDVTAELVKLHEGINFTNDEANALGRHFFGAIAKNKLVGELEALAKQMNVYRDRLAEGK